MGAITDSFFLNSPNMRNPMERVMSLLPMRDLVRLGETCTTQRKNVHDYWLQAIEAFKSLPATTEDLITLERRTFCEVIINDFLNGYENRDFNWDSESLKFCLCEINGFRKRYIRPRNERFCNLKKLRSGEVNNIYQKKYNQDLLIFANVIAERLSLPMFNSPSEARTWINDLNNQAQLQGIEELDLSKKGIEILPAEIGKLTALKKLNIRNNQLTSLPREIDQLEALESLNARGNQLTSLPREIGQLAALESFNVRDNQLKCLPPEIGQLAALESLNVSGNKLTSLPGEIGQLTALEWLYINGNLLTSLPGEIGKLATLESLDASSNQLTSLPREIVRLAVLEMLDVSNNQLTSLPREIEWLTALERLYINGNLLTSLPPGLEGREGLSIQR